MSKQLAYTDHEISAIYERNKIMLYHVCFSYLKNSADTEDAVSDTFIKLIKAGVMFENNEHEKAWLIRTASNLCKNRLRHWWRKRTNLSEIDRIQGASDEAEVEIVDVLRVVMDLSDKYKTVIYLYYYEGYNSNDIAKILQKPPSTIRNHLHEARNLLRERLGDYFDE